MGFLEFKMRKFTSRNSGIMDKKLFKIFFLFGIGLAVVINLGATLDWFKMSEEDLIGWSYYWVFPIVYGGTGWLTYDKRFEAKKSTHTIPLIASGIAISLLMYFLVEIFPEL